MEAGHRCAIPTCRHIEVDIHHIRPWRQSQEHDYDHLIALCPNCHRRADRGEIDRKSLYTYKRNLRTAHDRFSKMELDFLFAAYNGLISTCYPAFMEVMYQRLLDAGFLAVSRGSHGIQASVHYGIDMTPTHFMISPKGRAYVDSLNGAEEDEEA